MDTESLHQTLTKLLHAIRAGDIGFYKRHVSTELTCFEPESDGHIVDGLPFHEFFMTNFAMEGPYHLEIVRPTIQVYGSVGYTAYSLVILSKDEGKPKITSVNETRIWEYQDDRWVMVHFHRS